MLPMFFATLHTLSQQPLYGNNLRNVHVYICKNLVQIHFLKPLLYENLSTQNFMYSVR